MLKYSSIPQIVHAEQIKLDEIIGKTPDGKPFCIPAGTWKVMFDNEPGHIALFTDDDFKKNFQPAPDDDQDDTTPAPESVVSGPDKDEKKANILIV